MKQKKQLKTIRIYRDDLIKIESVYGSLQVAVDVLANSINKAYLIKKFSTLTKDQMRKVLLLSLSGYEVSCAINLVVNPLTSKCAKLPSVKD